MKENKYASLLQAGFEIFELIEPQPNEEIGRAHV